MASDRHDLQHAFGLFEDRYGPLSHGAQLGDLADLLQQFSHLPYENFSKILVWNGGRRAPRLRWPRTVMEEHLAWGTGGTCFSLTELLRHLVRRAGLSCHPVMAHMRHGPNIHCALLVEIGTKAYLVDPGYLVRQPLALRSADPRLKEPGRGEPLIVPAGSVGPLPSGIPGGDFDLFTLEAEGPRWRYRFSVQPPSEEAFLAFWRDSFFQPGMCSLLASHRSEQGELYFLHNHKLRHHAPSSKTTKNIRALLEDTVQQIFGIDPRITRQAMTLIKDLKKPPTAEPGSRVHQRFAGEPEPGHQGS